MTARAKRGASAPTYATSREAFDAWREAATQWRKLRSEAAAARCRAARSAYYTLAHGDVPPIQAAQTTREEAAS